MVKLRGRLEGGGQGGRPSVPVPSNLQQHARGLGKFQSWGLTVAPTHPELASFSGWGRPGLEGAAECEEMAPLLPVPGYPCESARGVVQRSVSPSAWGLGRGEVIRRTALLAPRSAELLRRRRLARCSRAPSPSVPPREPVLSCRSNTYPKGFYCTWHLPTPTYIPNTFNVTVLHGSKIMACEKDPALKNRCHIRYMHLFSTIKYKVSISVSNALGRNATAITFDEFTIVKPDPPENVVARPVPSNPRRLEVTWQTPSTWPDPESFPLKFFLRYRPLILDQWQHVELSDGTAHTITDAYAGKEYIIQVAAKDNEIGTWSDWSVAAHATPWVEEPRHLTTEAQVPETTTSTTSSLAPPPTTKICDPGELGSGGGPSIPFLTSVPITLALAAAAATANNLLIW
ncbi:ciliary neurotrophic factor receptor subunit alpha [Psammomys obesus]|uniref:ciliary neurotrophic factor receptor subunit alpha n=1 Tax=Psammomys obesus TaxID=48139 RepID=UPI00245320FE|nr:ciliary neurotrophic factor receptor subunit alpha [Psammomys obesus]